MQASLVNEFDGLTFTAPNGGEMDGIHFTHEFYSTPDSNLTRYKWTMIPIMVGFGVVFITAGIWLLNTLKFDKDPKRKQFDHRTRVSQMPAQHRYR